MTGVSARMAMMVRLEVLLVASLLWCVACVVVVGGRRMAFDEVYPRQYPCLRAFDLGAHWGPGELDGDQTKAEEHGILPRFGPLGRVKTYVLLV
jgi:hypothetical protein